MTLEMVRTYYGETLSSSTDLKTTACCTPDEMPEHVKKALAQVHDDVISRYYGCGLVVPEALEGAAVLDLGCGAGRDVYLLAQLVGETGSVTGVDATPAQLDIARPHIAWHAERFGYAGPNTAFVAGEIERLDTLGLEPASYDVIVSNCVINLCTDKLAVLESAFDLLKPGGEIYFADVYADRRLAPSLASDPVLLGECLAGALYWNDFLTLAKKAGFADPRLVEDRPIEITDPAIAGKLGAARFFSATYRLVKIDGLDNSCEDYGQAVIYKGTLPEQSAGLRFDKHHVMDTGKIFPVCRNTFRMLRESRLAAHFEFLGDDARHYGIFADCGTVMPFDTQGGGLGAACC